MEQCSINRSLLLNTFILWLLVVFPNIATDCHETLTIYPDNNVTLTCPTVVPRAHKYWKYEIHHTSSYFLCIWCDVDAHPRYFDFRAHGYSKVTIYNVKPRHLQIKCLERVARDFRLNCVWDINVLSRSTPITTTTTTERSTTRKAPTYSCFLNSGVFEKIENRTIIRGNHFNVSSVFQSAMVQFLRWQVCVRGNTRLVGECSRQENNIVCKEYMVSNNYEFKTKLTIQGMEVFVQFVYIRSDISDIQIQCMTLMSNWSHSAKLWVVSVSNQVPDDSTRPVHVNQGDSSNDFLLPILIAVPSSVTVLVLIVIIVVVCRRRKRALSSRRPAEHRVTMSRRRRRPSSTQNRQVSLWLTQISARVTSSGEQHPLRPSAYDEPPSYDSLDHARLHETNFAGLTLGTISIFDDINSESNDYEDPPPYPGI